MITKFRVWDKHRKQMNHRVLVGDCDENSDNYTCPVIWIDEEQNGNILMIMTVSCNQQD